MGLGTGKPVGKSKSEIRISGMKHFGWEQIDNGRGSIRQIGNTDVHIHFMRSTQLSSFNLPGKIQLPRVRSENLSSQFRSRICFVSQNFPCFWIFPINIVLIIFFLFSDFFYKYSIQSVNMIYGVGRYEIFLSLLSSLAVGSAMDSHATQQRIDMVVPCCRSLHEAAAAV